MPTARKPIQIAKEAILIFRCQKRNGKKTSTSDTSTSGRAQNGRLNDIRESVLEALFNKTIPVDFFTDEAYSTEWTNLESQWRKSVLKLCDKPNDSVLMRHLGGRNNYKDFAATFKNCADTVHEAKVEFKHNAQKLSDLPQILQLPANSTLFGSSYAEFYYDNYLKAYVDADGAFPIPIPDRETYLRCIHQIDYDMNPFFRMAHDRDDVNHKNKDLIVKKSKLHYLSLLNPDLNRLSNYLEETQKDKDFLLWDGNVFHHEKFNPVDLKLTSFDGISRKTTLLFSSETMVYGFTLCWRNRQGVLMPAWQIKVRKVK